MNDNHMNENSWRLVAVEPPPEKTPVWLWDGEHCFFGERIYDDDCGFLFAKCFFAPFWDMERGWLLDGSEFGDYNPTHWHPFPQPPG